MTSSSVHIYTLNRWMTSRRFLVGRSHTALPLRRPLRREYRSGRFFSASSYFFFYFLIIVQYMHDTRFEVDFFFLEGTNFVHLINNSHVRNTVRT